MARWILLALLTALGTYAVFFHELGDKPFSGHVSDVWRSPTMQQKVRMVERGVGSQWFAPPPTPPPPPPAPRARPATPQRNTRSAPTASNAHNNVHGNARGNAHGNQDDSDRRSLDALVDKLRK